MNFLFTRTNPRDAARQLESYSEDLAHAAYDVRAATANLLIWAEDYREHHRLEIEDALGTLKRNLEAFERYEERGSAHLW
jgi:hypothetical protein